MEDDDIDSKPHTDKATGRNNKPTVIDAAKVGVLTAIDMVAAAKYAGEYTLVELGRYTHGTTPDGPLATLIDAADDVVYTDSLGSTRCVKVSGKSVKPATVIDMTKHGRTHAAYLASYARRRGEYVVVDLGEYVFGPDTESRLGALFQYADDVIYRDKYGIAHYAKGGSRDVTPEETKHDTFAVYWNPALHGDGNHDLILGRMKRLRAEGKSPELVLGEVSSNCHVEGLIPKEVLDAADIVSYTGPGTGRRMFYKGPTPTADVPLQTTATLPGKVTTIRWGNNVNEEELLHIAHQAKLDGSRLVLELGEWDFGLFTLTGVLNQIYALADKVTYIHSSGDIVTHKDYTGGHPPTVKRFHVLAYPLGVPTLEERFALAKQIYDQHKAGASVTLYMGRSTVQRVDDLYREDQTVQSVDNITFMDGHGKIVVYKTDRESLAQATPVPEEKTEEKQYIEFPKMLSFSDALASVKQGNKATRLAWGVPTSATIFLGVPSTEWSMSILQSNREGRTTPWYPTSMDILADDWLVIVSGR